MSAWLSPPAFLCVLSTVSKTSTPASRASRTVASVQLSATTTTRAGGSDWESNEASVSEMQDSSLCAGISTVMVTGPA